MRGEKKLKEKERKGKSKERQKKKKRLGIYSSVVVVVVFFFFFFYPSSFNFRKFLGWSFLIILGFPPRIAKEEERTHTHTQRGPKKGGKTMKNKQSAACFALSVFRVVND